MLMVWSNRGKSYSHSSTNKGAVVHRCTSMPSILQSNATEMKKKDFSRLSLQMSGLVIVWMVYNGFISIKITPAAIKCGRRNGSVIARRLGAPPNRAAKLLCMKFAFQAVDSTLNLLQSKCVLFLQQSAVMSRKICLICIVMKRLLCFNCIRDLDLFMWEYRGHDLSDSGDILLSVFWICVCNGGKGFHDCIPLTLPLQDILNHHINLCAYFN